MRGTVKWYNVNKGYGFIIPEDESPDVFVHFSTILRSGIKTLDEGEAVTFEAEPGRNGKPRAAKVEVARG